MNSKRFQCVRCPSRLLFMLASYIFQAKSNTLLCQFEFEFRRREDKSHSNQSAECVPRNRGDERVSGNLQKLKVCEWRCKSIHQVMQRLFYKERKQYMYYVGIKRILHKKYSFQTALVLPYPHKHTTLIDECPQFPLAKLHCTLNFVAGGMASTKCVYCIIKFRKKQIPHTTKEVNRTRTQRTARTCRRRSALSKNTSAFVRFRCAFAAFIYCFLCGCVRARVAYLC